MQGAGLVTGAFAVVAENSILGTVHFAAAVVWQRGGVRADSGSALDLSALGKSRFNYI